MSCCAHISDIAVNSIVGAIAFVVRRLPTEAVERLIRIMFKERSTAIKPDDALRFLFRLDTSLYWAEGVAAGRYGKGVHPKHRLTGYHDFFASRINDGESILDIGCGNGALAADIAGRHDVQITAIDCSAEAISSAEQMHAHPSITYTCADICDRIPDGEYDVVILSNVLEHIENRSEFLGSLVVAAKEARFLVRVPLYEREWRVPLRQELGVEWRLDQDHAIEYSPESFRDEMDHAGIRLASQEIRWGEIWAEGRCCE